MQESMRLKYEPASELTASLSWYPHSSKAIFDPKCAANPLPYPYEPPYVPPVLPTKGAVEPGRVGVSGLDCVDDVLLLI